MKILLENLGLAECYGKKLTLHRLLQINKKSVTDVPVQSLSDLPWLFLKRLMLLQRTARSVKCSSIDGAEDSDWDDDQDSTESDCPQLVNPLDVLTAVFLCSDSFLQQEMIMKMSMCQFAIPLLLPNSDSNQIMLMLWAMRDIVKKYRPHSLSDASGFVEERIVLSNLPLVSFVRLGRCNISKSEILNKVLSNPQQYTDTFVHLNMGCGNIKKKISNGLVEMAWYLPCGNENIDVFPEPIAIANLRGDILNFETQFSFLCEASTAVFVFFESQLLETQFISVSSQKPTPQLFFVGDSNNNSIKATVKKLNLKKSNFIFKASQNDADFVHKIQSKLRDTINNNHHKTSVIRLAEIARNLRILVDEDSKECQRAKKIADEITSKIEDIVQFKKQELPLQGEILMKLAKLEKEEYRLKNIGDKKNDDYKKELKNQKKKLREEQYRKDISFTMSCFISAISTPERDYFLKWLRIALENRSHEVLPKLRELYKQKCQDICGNKTEIAELDKKISNSSLGVEHFIREMSQLYEAAVSLPEYAPNRKQLEHLPRLCAELLLGGFSLELVDGDSSNIPEKWLSGVFYELNRMVEPKNKIKIVTVLGVQSSGKSTLLNTMFGVQFAVSSGRCTRGAFMQLIKVADDRQAELKCDYIVIIDTEGLKSPELAQLDNSHEHDNELATIVVGLSDVTIVNIAMENSTEMKDILQIIVHAFLRMKEIGKKHTCLFVHQNVADVSAHVSNMRDRKFLLEQLDEMTKAAAKMEKKLEFSKFTDVLKYDTATGDHYIPGLWHGNPPMAPVSIGYSESVYNLKKHIMEIFKSYESYNINEFLKWTKDLWTAVKFENFIFSFRNSLVADAYMKLCTEFNKWDWTLRKQMHSWALEAETKILNHGKFENSESVEDVRSRLLRETEAKLSKGQKEIIDKIKSYYQQREGHVELVENYRQDFINSATSLKMELSNSVTSKLDAAVSRRNGMIKVEGIKKTYMDTMEKKVLNLLKNCRKNDTDMSDDKLDEAFEKMWRETVNTLAGTGLKQQDIKTKVLLHLMMSLKSRGSSMAQSLDKVKDLNSHGHGDFVVKNDGLLSTILKFFSAQKIKNVQEMSDNLIRDCWEFVKAKRESKDDYDDTYIRRILNMIDEKLKDNEDLKLKEDFELSLKLHICGFASREFQEIHNKFIKQNNPRTALENFKQTYRSDFIDLYREQDQCQRKADEFMKNCLKPALERYISENLGMKMADKMVTGENSAIFGTRTTFQISVLKNLLDKFKFETYLHFISSYETFVKTFILDKIKKHFSEENRMFTLEENIVNEVISEIKKAIEEAGQDPKINDIKGFIENFCKKLEKKFVFPKDAVDKISTLNNANLKRFAECLQCSVMDMDKSLKVSFQAIDFQSKIYRLETKPQDVLFQRVHGCGKQCPFCKAPCEAGGDKHTKHFVSIHRPEGLGRYRFDDSKKLVTDICSSSVHGNSSFKCGDTKDQWHPYKEYSKIYPDWRIDPDPSIEASAYWKYVMAEFNEQFAEKYNAKPAEIPWGKITKADAEKCLNIN
ncbi:up-regulator of cell proliferation-like [Pimephales promelas]|uniref:up-regulator of cell proliferation-like n=1 Tax=Pimephales promelas TaxID=90988 RepID=UPI0019559AC1|nr:up-regulator of cell proliferation-like [Pimephales promelas]KAG1926093.1 interferon-induced very large GTPase 1-like [Pimephales promelas]